MPLAISGSDYVRMRVGLLERPADAPVAESKHGDGDEIKPEEIIKPVFTKEEINAYKGIEQHPAGPNDAC